jgi:hypothetical protein
VAVGILDLHLVCPGIVGRLLAELHALGAVLCEERLDVLDSGTVLKATH